MEMLHEIIAVNREGIRSFDAGQIPNAIRVFEAGLSMMRHIVDERDLARITPHSEKGTWLPCGREAEYLRLSDRIGMQSDRCWVFDRPLILPVDPKLETHDDLETFIHWMSTAILFNYALAHHQYGTMSRTEAALDKAARLYHLVLTMVDNADSDLCDECFDVVECAALNNMSHISYIRGEFQKSTLLLDAMCETAVATKSLQYYLSCDDVEQILFNKFFMVPPVAAQAA
jgi:hypothetical protein